MEIILGVLIAIVGVLTVLVLRSLTTLFHELGHALPALLFTNEEVKLYVGSYGDINNSLRLKIFKLRMFLKFNLFDWKIGMCTHSGTKHLWQTIIIIISGPIASILIVVILSFMAQSHPSTSVLFTIFMLFVISAVTDFVINIIPSSNEISMHDGQISFSDGYLLLTIVKRAFLSDNYLLLESHFQREDHYKVIEIGAEMLDKGINERNIYDILISSLKETNNYNDALSVFNQLAKDHKLNEADHHHLGQIHMKLHHYEEALGLYNHAHYKNYSDSVLLADMGYVKIQLGRFEDALLNLKAAIYYSPTYIKSYLYRAYALIKKKEYQYAFEDLKIAKQLNENHPLLSLYSAIYYENQGNYKDALTHYKKAKELDCDYHGIDYKIDILGSKLN